MATEILLIGSNVDRERSIDHVLRALLQLADTVHVSRILETAPVGLVDGGASFFNVAAALPWDPPTTVLKARLIEIETSLGRNRLDACRSRKSHRADIDPILRMMPSDRHVDLERLPRESYARDAIVDLLAHLGIACVGSLLALPDAGVEIVFGRSRVGGRPTTLTRAWLAEAS